MKTFMKTFYSNYTNPADLYNRFVKKHPEVTPIFMSTANIDGTNNKTKLSVTVIFEGADPADAMEEYE